MVRVWTDTLACDCGCSTYIFPNVGAGALTRVIEFVLDIGEGGHDLQLTVEIDNTKVVLGLRGLHVTPSTSDPSYTLAVVAITRGSRWGCVLPHLYQETDYCLNGHGDR